MQAREGEEVLKQAYQLAIQSNAIQDYLKRFDAAVIPSSCQATVAAQVTKLKSMQTIIWNTMIAMAAGSVTVDDATLKSLLNKQAGDTEALLGMEKLVIAITGDATPNWAGDIEKVLHQATQIKTSDPDYDDPYEPESEAEPSTSTHHSLTISKTQPKLELVSESVL